MPAALFEHFDSEQDRRDREWLDYVNALPDVDRKPAEHPEENIDDQDHREARREELYGEGN